MSANDKLRKPPGVNRRQWREMLRQQGLLGRQKEIEVSVPVVAPISNIRKTVLWLRGVGGISILIGGVSLIQTWFLAGIFGFYFGMLVLTLDALIEFRGRLRMLAPIAALTAAVIFSKEVVFRPSPIKLFYRTSADGHLLVTLINESNRDDYRNLDLSIYPANDLVGKSEQVTNVPSVTFINDQMLDINTYDGRPGIISIPISKVPFHPDDPRAAESMKVSFGRFTCERLSKASALTLRLAVFTVKDPSRFDPNVQGVRVIGTYEGRFKPVSIDITSK